MALGYGSQKALTRSLAPSQTPPPPPSLPSHPTASPAGCFLGFPSFGSADVVSLQEIGPGRRRGRRPHPGATPRRHGAQSRWRRRPPRAPARRHPPRPRGHRDGGAGDQDVPGGRRLHRCIPFLVDVPVSRGAGGWWRGGDDDASPGGRRIERGRGRGRGAAWNVRRHRQLRRER